jgi:hypothetical protein
MTRGAWARQSRLLGATAIALAGVSGANMATSSAHLSKADRTCRPAGSSTVAADAGSRVYSLPKPVGATDSGPARLYGCTLATGHSVLLAQPIRSKEKK